MTAKAGQKCTAIRRIIVPQDQIDAVSQALIARLEKVVVGDPAQEGVKMGSWSIANSVRTCRRKWISLWPQAAGFAGRKSRSAGRRGVLPAPALCPQPDETPAVHATEAFGPVATLRHADHAMQLARAGGGSWPGTLVTADPALARQFISAARAHGRIQILNEESSKESTGHGSPSHQLVHGGPGRAGGGEELGGLRAVKHYMQRTAIQGSPTMLAAIGKQWVRGATVHEDRVHPFRKYFEELQPGDSLLTPRRTPDGSRYR